MILNPQSQDLPWHDERDPLVEPLFGGTVETQKDAVPSAEISNIVPHTVRISTTGPALCCHS